MLNTDAVPITLAADDQPGLQLFSHEAREMKAITKLLKRDEVLTEEQYQFMDSMSEWLKNTCALYETRRGRAERYKKMKNAAQFTLSDATCIPPVRIP
jgi:hypothetical protein